MEEEENTSAEINKNLKELFFELMRLDIEAIEKKEKIAEDIQEIVDLCK